MLEYDHPMGEQEVVGVVRKTEKRGNFTPDNNVEKQEFYWLDHETVGEATQTGDYSVRLDLVKKGKGYPIGGQTVFWMPNNHVTYIATWYGLSACLIAVQLLARKGKIR